ncbi:S-adenosyl-L-methionine-dependent methyltransferase [Trametopsis cervina]|nr:S-adenosyl-L-methionine-dependent methyltransferase [Trametopsis cervina]
MSDSSQEVALEATALAALYPSLSEKHRDVVALPQMQHRIDLVKYWGIRSNDNVLEIGCGQGDCTVALAAAVGSAGHVTAVDPASLDYGNPFTLGQAQAHISASPLGSRITFVQADPLAHIKTGARYDVAVIAHCIWYFSSPHYLEQLLSALKPYVDRICIAEWALRTTDPLALPHVLAALTQASMECRKQESKSNIRTVLSPSAIHAVALTVGLEAEMQETFAPDVGMLDGSWEVGEVVGDDYVRQIEEHVKDERERAVVLAMRDAVRANYDVLKVKGEKVRSMDVWVVRYKVR